MCKIIIGNIITHAICVGFSQYTTDVGTTNYQYLMDSAFKFKL